MQIYQDWKEFIELLNLENVRYLVIGGWAHNRYATPRFTGDIDFFVGDDRENEARLRSVLAKFGFESILPAPDRPLFEKKIIMLGRPPFRIDLLKEISGVDFEIAWNLRESGMIGGVPACFISRDLLIQNKLAAGRDKDLVDVKSLRW